MKKIAWLSLASAIISWVGFTILRNSASFGWIPLSPNYGFWFPAFFFAIIVLIPQIRLNRFAIFRAIALLLLSFSAWYLAFLTVFFFWQLYFSIIYFGFLLAGIVGALIMAMGCRVIGHWKLAGKELLKCAGFGGLGGLFLGFGIFIESEWLKDITILLGFIIWQYGVAFYLTRKIRDAAEDYFFILSPNRLKRLWLYILMKYEKKY